MKKKIIEISNHNKIVKDYITKNKNINTEMISVNIIGEMGSGKSSLFNILCEQKYAKTSSSGFSCTNMENIKRTLIDVVEHNKMLIVTDSPGFEQAEKNYIEDHLTQIYFQLLHENNVFLFVLKKSRINDITLNLIDYLDEKFGQIFWDRTILILNGCDKAFKNEHGTYEDVIDDGNKWFNDLLNVKRNESKKINIIKKIIIF